MPNTRVKFTSALIAGIIAGSIFQLTQWGYIHFQIGVSRYGAIYGSFAAFPLFLIWLQISWLIILLGAEISFAVQNVRDYEFEYEAHNISQSYKKLISLLVTSTIVKSFEKGEKALTSIEISQQLEIPIRLIKRSINDLLSAGILNDTSAEGNKGRAFQPALDIAQINIAKVISALDESGVDKLALSENSLLINLQEKLENIKTMLEKSEQNVLLKDI